MRFNRLGIKLFISFVLVQTIVGVLVFNVFRSSQELEPAYQHMAKNIMVIKLILEETGRENMARTLTALSRTGPVMAWVTDAQGNMLASTFSGEVPPEARDLSDYRSWELGEATLYQVRQGETEAVAAAPLNFSGEAGNVYLSSRLRERVAPEQKFLIGLLPVLIAGIIMVFLLTAFISRPLRRLHNAVSAMASGNLASRVKISNNDELGDLGRSFNHMADSLERLIQGNRELMSNVSHQLRTPLTRMGLSLELLHDEMARWEMNCPTAPEQKDKISRHMGLLHTEIELMNSLIGKILLLSRLDIADAQALRLSPCRLDRLLSEIASSFAPLLEARQLRLSLDIADLPMCQFDVDSLAIALENIMDNAVKYALPGGQVSIAARLEDRATPGSRAQGQTICVRLCNSAQAMEPDDITSILKPFARGQDRSIPGSGLGLTISKKIIEGHGGKFAVSYKNDLFCILLELPLAQSGAFYNGN